MSLQHRDVIDVEHNGTEKKVYNWANVTQPAVVRGGNPTVEKFECTIGAGDLPKKPDYITEWLALAESRRRVEVPQEKQERGNVTTVGSIDLTDLPRSEGSEQSFQDRPVKHTGGGPDQGDADANGDAPPSHEPRITVELATDDVFEIVRNADYWTARHVFDQLICDHEDNQ